MKESIIIGIAGGTGSGKTTFTKRIKETFGNSVVIICHDNYYKSCPELSFEQRTKINYDHPDALETEMLIEHILKLQKGEAINCPIYDYSRHERSKDTYEIKPTKIIVVEGILVLQNEILRDMFDIKIYVEADADERIMRRAIRDIKERGRDLEDIFEQYTNTVKPMHYQYVEPTRSIADIVINSGTNDVAFDILRTKIKQYLLESEKSGDCDEN